MAITYNFPALISLAVALAYGIYSIAYQLTAKQMTKYLARLFYWIFLCVGPFSIVDIFAKLQLKKFTMERE